MTGVGKAVAHYQNKTITVFIKTLNSKQLDTSTRIASLYREREIEIRNFVAEHLVRGKVELTISVEERGGTLSGVQRLNSSAIHHYIEELRQVGLDVDAEGVDLATLLRLPGVLEASEPEMSELSEGEWQAVRETLVEALAEVRSFRAQEGVMLYEVLERRIRTIETLLGEVDLPEAERIETIRQRLEEALGKLSPEGIDRGRLEQELIYYIDKLDINEEKDRLRHHLGYFIEVMDLPEGQQGKTLGFIAQEIGREINTLGSKSNHAALQQIVVKMKDELEQIKEQSLNVL